MLVNHILKQSAPSSISRGKPDVSKVFTGGYQPQNFWIHDSRLTRGTVPGSGLTYKYLTLNPYFDPEKMGWDGRNDVKRVRSVIQNGDIYSQNFNKAQSRAKQIERQVDWNIRNGRLRNEEKKSFLNYDQRHDQTRNILL